MNRDKDRFDRIMGLMAEDNIDYIVVFDEVNVRYLAGSPIDYSACVMHRDGELILVVPPMEYERAKSVSWVDNVYRYGSGEGGDWIKAENLAEAVAKIVDGRVGIPYNYISLSLYERFKSSLSNSSIVDCDSIIKRARSVKTGYELDFLSKAVDLVESGIEYAINTIDVGVTETYVARESIIFFYRNGADRVYSDLIVASGYRSAFPHGRATDKMVGEAEPITLDYVAAYGGYWGDVTRTFFLKRVDAELRRVYEIVEEALYTAVDKVCSGVSAKEVDEAARKVIERSGYKEFFIHSTGHGVGLEVHESPRLSSRSNDILMENMVLTIEPGIYIKDLGGVRIENDVVVKKSGATILNKLTTDLIII